MNLGLFVDYMHNAFQHAVITRIADAVYNHGARLWCFEYPYIQNETQKFKPSLLLSLISKRNINGLIIIPGSLEQNLCTEQFYLHIKQQLSIPIIFLLSPVKMVPFIRVDNEDGIRKLLFHLFADHGYRRPVFIKGTFSNNDVNSRFTVFNSICNDYGIHVEDSLSCKGNHLFITGRQAAMKLLNEKTLTNDVIIAANDLMAAGAMFELQTHGVRIPEDIAVTGFDDLVTARFMNPPLTTVKQPLSEMGYKAVEYIGNLLKGNKVPQKTILPGELMVRHSCGCVEPGKKRKTDEILQQIKTGRYRERKSTIHEPYILRYKTQELVNYNDKNLDKIMRYLGQHYADSELTISKVEKATGIPSLKIAKIIKEKFRIHFKKLLNKIRCTEAKRLLEKTDRYITDIAFQVGYNSRNHFYKAFIQCEGISPKEYKRLF